MSSPMPSLQQMRLIAQVLTLHFEESRPQADIAKELGLSSAKVNRLIKRGRELGMVQITIKSPLLRLFDLEKLLSDRWRLRTCLVVAGPTGSPEASLNEVCKAAASHLSDILRDGDTVAVSGGKTVSTVIQNLSSTRAFDVNVVPMAGGVQNQHYTDVNHLATELARKLGGRATLIHAPLHASSREERDVLMKLKTVDDAMDQARRASIALVGIGAVLGADSTYYEAHPVSEIERRKLYASGVRSEFLGHLIDQNGALSDNDLNSRVVALPPQELVSIPRTIAIGSGPEKVEPIRAALNSGYFNSLVTDELTARAILQDPETTR